MKTKTLLSALLLFVTVCCLAQEGWISDKNSGCKCYTMTNVTTRSIKWDGACTDGYISGYGKCEVYEGDILTYTYNGNAVNGKFSGQGTQIYAVGDKYIGEWKESKRSGRGTYYFKNGNIYIGEWREGSYNGQGTLTFANGEKYVGEWKNSKINGQGTLTYATGDIYVGIWTDGVMNGIGSHTYPGSDKYVGEFTNNQPNGQGTLTYSNGEKYVGKWKDGNFNGQGTLNYKSGNIYTGEWKDGELNGQGIFTYSSGAKYVGGFLNGKETGQGELNYTSGDKYVGEFSNGKCNGQGTYYLSNGTKRTGLWKDDNLYQESTPTQLAVLDNGPSEYFSYNQTSGEYEIKDNNGKVTIHEKSGGQFDPSEGLSIAFIKFEEDWGDSSYKKYGFIDSKNKVIIPLQYKDVENFFNSVALVNVDDKHFELIDKTGKQIHYLNRSSPELLR